MGDGSQVSIARATLRLDAGVTLAGEGPLQQAVDIVAPANPLPIVLVCLPGGAMRRSYFDLRPPDAATGEAADDGGYSFARQMAARGFVSVLVDHLGVGDSSRPADGYALTPDLVARANGHVSAETLKRLRDGTAIPGVAALPRLASLGVGHSMGAMLTIIQQAQAPLHAGIAVLGFTTRGLPEYLTPEARELAKDPAAVRREVVRLARAMFREPYPLIGRSGDGAELFAGERAEAAGVQAIKAARERLLPVPAFLSMLPDNVGPEAARIGVPVFVGVGERDMTGDAQAIPPAFRASPGVTLHVMPGAGHSHFLFASRVGLFDALAQWARAVAKSV